MDFLDILRRDGRVQSTDATLTPLTGGVSSDIYLVTDGDRQFVVKRALDKLKVQQDWFADTGRNRNEYAYLQYVGGLNPQAVPAVIGPHESANYFCMEYLGEGFTNWKQAMLAGACDVAIAAAAADMLGQIHACSRGNQAVAAQFDTVANFEQLRISPYLLATADRHADLRTAIHTEADRLRRQREVLTHGDFSPKNILIGPGKRVVIVDCEVAWYGDAAFDIAFLLNHLLLKALVRPSAQWPAMLDSAWRAYHATMADATIAKRVEQSTARLLPMLMLARVDGKSPAEYLEAGHQQHVRSFSVNAIRSNQFTSIPELFSRWTDSLP